MFPIKNVFKILPNKQQLKMEQRALKNVNNCLNTNIYSYFETPVACTINM